MSLAPTSSTESGSGCSSTTARERAVPAAGQPGASPGDPLAWADRSGASWTWLDIVTGVCVVHLEGAPGARALPPLRAALDAARALRPARVVLDLQAADPGEPVTVTLLSLARRYLCSRGVAMTLVASVQVRDALRQAHVDELFDLAPSIAVAVARARLEQRPAPTPMGRGRVARGA